MVNTHTSHPVRVLAFPVETPIERAAHSVVVAMDDLESAIFTATNRRELVVLREMAAELVKRAEQCERAARTFDEHFDHMRAGSTTPAPFSSGN